MNKSDELANPSSCINKAAPDEPVFVLRGNDELAPDIVRAWVVTYRSMKGVAITPAQRAKANEALDLAAAMEAWRYHQASGQPRQFEFPGGMPPA